MARYAPIHFYRLAITEGIQSEYLTLPAIPEALKKVKTIEVASTIREEEYYQNLWKNFHIKNFVVPLPVRHPQLKVIPKLRDSLKSPRLGASMVNSNQEEIFEFMELEPFDMKLMMDEQKIFSLPIVRQEILKKSFEDVWVDLFSQTIGLENLQNFSFFSYSLDYQFEKRVYDLFLLEMRHYYFKGRKVEGLTYLKKINYGLLALTSLDERYNEEEIWILQNGVVYPVRMRTANWDPLAEAIRDRFIKTLKYKDTDQKSSEGIYSEYKTLPYAKKIDQEGMIYLFSAWSHNIDNEKFLKEMIQFLERGKNNQWSLSSLYDFALKKYGSGFSSKNDRETQAAALKRKMAEELEAERKLAAESQIQTEEQFDSAEEKVNYFLKKAKESGSNSDDSDKTKLER